MTTNNRNSENTVIIKGGNKNDDDDYYYDEDYDDYNEKYDYEDQEDDEAEAIDYYYAVAYPQTTDSSNSSSTNPSSFTTGSGTAAANNAASGAAAAEAASAAATAAAAAAARERALLERATLEAEFDREGDGQGGPRMWHSGGNLRSTGADEAGSQHEAGPASAATTITATRSQSVTVSLLPPGFDRGLLLPSDPVLQAEQALQRGGGRRVTLFSGSG